MTAKARDATPDRRDLTEKIIAEFRLFFRELRCMGSDRMRRGGVSMGNFHILSMLDRHGEMAMSRVAEVLDVSLSNASGIVDRLEERGLVERIRVPDDRRIVLVRMTAQGIKTLAELEVFKDGMLTTVLGQLDVEQLARVASALRDIEGAATSILSDDPDWQAHAQAHEHRLRDDHGPSHVHVTLPEPLALTTQGGN